MACTPQCLGCFSFFSNGAARASSTGTVRTSTRDRLALTDFPIDVVVNRLLPTLDASALATLATTCQFFATLVNERPQLWKSLAMDVLGVASCAVHEAAAIANSSLGCDDCPLHCSDVRWWQRLVLAATRGSALCWDPRISSRICGDIDAQRLLRCCAHTSITIGELVLLIGGKRMGRYSDENSRIIIINSRTCAVHAARLSDDSVVPPPFLRHAACTIASEPNGPPRALVLGGVVESGVHNIELLSAGHALVLELLSDGIASSEACVVRWSWKTFGGDGLGATPETPLFHHVMCSYDNGKRVLAWGGDSLDFNDPYGQVLAQNECTDRSKSVFILDVETWKWSRVMTSGTGPGHRSLAMAVVHRNRLIILGGSSDPKPPRAYEVGKLADMTPRALDLRTWTWLEPVLSSIETPEPRTRFAADICGDWLLGFGGRGIYNDSLSDVFQLNLCTLNWVEPNVLNPEDVTDDEACASSMSGNLIIGGIAMGIPRAKADALLFSF